jgi:hypothetical protein
MRRHFHAWRGVTAHDGDDAAGKEKKNDAYEDPIVLPEGWFVAYTDPPASEKYYYCLATGETSWEIPIVLPDGWVKLYVAPHDAHGNAHEHAGRAYWYHASSRTSLWHCPTAADAAAAQDAVRRALALDQKIAKHHHALHHASSASSSSSNSSSGEDDEEKEGTRKKSRKYVRWIFKERDDMSLARSFLGNRSYDSNRDPPPPYLQEILVNIFVDGDRNQDGVLSTMEFTQMLQRRAKATVLEGNAHAMFSLQQKLEEQTDHGKIGVKEFMQGVWVEIMECPNGCVAQWILYEAQNEASRWTSKLIQDGVRIYQHCEDGRVASEEPQILSEMRRCAEDLHTRK